MSYFDDGKLPIIYVRGFAGGTATINKAVDDPFYGFSQGSVHVRTDSHGHPQFHQFESPMLRLMSDQSYTVPVYGDQQAYLEGASPGALPAATIWIHRFYDASASTLAANADGFSLEKAADHLFQLIQVVLDKTGAPRVFLVAHSMGGLICRAVLQKVIPETTSIASGVIDYAAGADFVERLFTYATPHGGIRFALGEGLLEKARDATGIHGTDIFGPDRMYEYLTPKAARTTKSRQRFQATVVPPNSYPVERIFCLVGSNPNDYEVARGLSSAVVGARSDGLVQIENAAVKDAHRAVVHRSHSGRYGIVNSEEGYQNLQRFLFGDLEVKVEMLGLEIGRTAPENIEFQLDVGLAIRGLPILVHEQTAAHHCPVFIERSTHIDSVDTPKPLFTTFLSSSAPRPLHNGKPTTTLRHALKLRLLSIREEQGMFFFGDHLEQTEDWQDALLVDIEPGAADRLPRAWAAWTSGIPAALREWEPDATDELADVEKTSQCWVGEIHVPEVARRLLGRSARIRITVTPREIHGK